jgi:hypothetical protein
MSMIIPKVAQLNPLFEKGQYIFKKMYDALNAVAYFLLLTIKSFSIWMPTYCAPR